MNHNQEDLFNHDPSRTHDGWESQAPASVTLSPPQSTQSGGSSTPKERSEELERLERRRLQNRRSQRAHRKRKDNLLSSLEAHLTSLESENAMLREINGMLFSEVTLLQQANFTATALYDGTVEIPPPHFGLHEESSNGLQVPNQRMGLGSNPHSTASSIELEDREVVERPHGSASYDGALAYPQNVASADLTFSYTPTHGPRARHQPIKVLGTV